MLGPMNATATATPTDPPRRLLLWRWLALLYDFWPALALWMIVSTLFTVGYQLDGHASRQNIAPFSALQWLLWLCCWGVTGVYATVSWRRGGQTLGMRPWRLHLHGVEAGVRPSWGALWCRYSVGTLSLLLGGLGFWWAWLDRERLTLHDRASNTRLVRVPKQ